MKLVRLVACGAAMIATVACGAEKAIPGSAAGTGEDSTSTRAASTTAPAGPAPERTASAPTGLPSIPIAPRTTASAPRSSSAPDDLPPRTVDENLPAQYCDRAFRGALGKPMLAVVVETPAGILDCEEAAAILFDYYAERPDPEFGLAPVFIGPLACNQGAEGRMAQVICADGDNLIYSMWPQT
jgi:hypothetical protein